MKFTKIGRTTKFFLFSFVAATFLSSASTTIESSEYVGNVDFTQGLRMTPTEFNMAFTGDECQRIMPFSISESNSSISNVEIKENNEINFDLTLLERGQEFELSISGIIYQGNRGEGNFIVHAPSGLNDGYEIILIEINTTNTRTNLLLPTSHSYNLEAQPHLKIYLKNDVGELILFEKDLPEELRYLNTKEVEYNKEFNHLGWAIPFVELEVFTEKLTREELRRYGLEFATPEEDYIHIYEFELSPYDCFESLFLDFDAFNTQSFTWITNTATVTIGRDTAVVRSAPYINRTHRNITGTGGWELDFRVSENTRIYNSGEFLSTHYGQAFFKYRNIDIRASVGNNSHIRQVSRSGRVLEERALLGNIVRQAGASIATNLIWRSVTALTNATASSVLQNLTTSLSRSSRTIALGSGNREYFTASPTLAHVTAGWDLPRQFSVHRNSANATGHHFQVHWNIGTHQTRPQQTTHGAKFVQFRIYDNNGTRFLRTSSTNPGFTYTIRN